VALRTLRVDEVVDRLKKTEGAPITSERIADLLCDVRLEESSLRPFTAFADDHYARHLVHRDAHFDILVICWKPGQGTPIHTHNGQLGWAFTTRGALECTEYRYLGCDRPENQNVSGIDCLAGGMQVKLDRIGGTLCTPGGDLNRVTRQVTIHSLVVPPDCREPVVSFHVYSLPFDSCVVFDVAQGRCTRKELLFDTAPDGYSVRTR
jgi:predicted metal-dependent enzyme (double-stranded beta helix superfamily)